MGVGGNYTIKVKAELDGNEIQEQLNKLSKNAKIDFGDGAKKLGEETEETTKKVKSLQDIGRLAFNRVAVAVFDKAVSAAMNAVSDMVSNVFELDAALVEYRKVSDLSGESLDNFVNKAYEAGSTVARTGTEMIEAATQFKKMGYADKTSLTLGTLAAKFQNIADTEISAGDAALFINSQMKAFNITAGDAEHILDAVNETANNFAVGTNDLQGALTVAGSSMSTVGNTFEETIGLITAATELMPGKAQTVGNSFRTIGINIANMAKSADSWVAANGRINVALKDSEGNLRSTYDIMQDLNNGIEGQSVAWKDLTEAEQNEIALAAGGKTRYQAFVAAMNNFESAVKATETALNSEGSAQKENEKYMDSLEGALQRVRSAWENFSRQILSSGLIKGVLNGIASAMELLSSDAGVAAVKIGGLVAIIAGIGKGLSKLEKISKVVGAFKSFVGITTKAQSAASGAAEATEQIAEAAGGAAGKAKGIVSALGGVPGVVGLGVAALMAAVGVANWLDDAVGRSIEKYEETRDQIQANQSEIDTLLNKTEALTDEEADRLALLQAQNEELKRQASDEAQKAVDKAIGGVGTGLVGLDEDDYADKLKQVKNQYAGIGDAINNVQKAQQLYAQGETKTAEKQIKANEKYIKSVREQATELDKAFKTKIEQGDELTDSEQKIYEQNQKVLASLKEYDDMDFGTVDAFTKMFPDAKQLANTEAGMAEMRDRAREIIKALQQGDAGAASFKQLMNDIEGGYEKLGQFDEASGKFKFDNANIKDYAEALGITVDYAEQLLQAQTENGQIEWNLPADTLTNFQSALMLTGESLNDLDGNMVISSERIANMAEAFGIPQAAIPTLTAALTEAGAKIIDFSGDTGTVVSQLESLGEVSGIVRDELGNITSVNVEQLGQSIKELGGSQDDLATLLEYLNTIDGLKFEGDFENTIKGAETAKVAANELWKTLEDLPTDKDITISAKDNATGEIVDVTITAEELNNEYVAKLSAEDRASTLIAYAQEKANGYTGDYVAYLKSIGAGEVEKEVEGAKKSTDDFTKGTSEKKITAKDETSQGVESAKKSLRSVKNRKVTITVTTKQRTIKGKARGTRNAPEGFSEVNEQGWEFIRDRKTGQLRVAGGGERTVTYLNKGDIVYPHQESVRMLADKNNISIGQHKDGSPNWRQQRQIESWMSHQRRGKQTFNQTWQNLLSYQRQGIIDEDDYVKYIRDASEADIEWRMELYKRNKATYSEMTALIQSHFNSGYMLAENYYKALEDLAKEAKEKEEDRLNSLKSQQKNAYDLAKLYVQQQIDLIDKENEVQEEQNELLEIQNQLTEARNKKVRVYREGIGFVYESDASAIKEATDALKEYNTEKEKEAKKKPWQDILDLFDQQETLRDIKELENKLGQTTTQLFGGMGTNLTAWTEWVKTNLSTTLGLENILEELGNVEGLKWITEYLNSSMQVDQSKIQAAINKNKFASGTLSAPGGISRVGEHGYELAMLGAGDAVLPHTVSKNLMEIGKYSAVEWKKMLRNSDSETVNQYSFDKLVLPNVKSADDFIRELKKLPNQGIQKVGSRR